MGGIHAKRIGGGTDNKKLTGNKIVEQMKTKSVTKTIMSLKLATWNLCLGLTNKKDIVLEEIAKNEIDICCLQETEIVKNYDFSVLNSKDYNNRCHLQQTIS